MAKAHITMRIGEDLKARLQELVSNLGMDMTTFLQYQQSVGKRKKDAIRGFYGCF